MPERFSADEAHRIFARAARRQHAAPAGDGLTSEELAEIGRAAGLDPALVLAEAASERMGDRPPATWHGVPVSVRRARLLSARVSDAEWERVVDLLRDEFKTLGTAQQIGRRREWVTRAGTADAYRVTVDERPDGDLVTVEAPNSYRLAGVLLGSLLGGMGLVLGTLLALTGEPDGLGLAIGGLFVGLAVLLYGVLFLTAKRAASRLPARFGAVLDRVELASRTDDGSVASRDPTRTGPSHTDVEVGSAEPVPHVTRRVRS